MKTVGHGLIALTGLALTASPALAQVTVVGWPGGPEETALRAVPASAGRRALSPLPDRPATCARGASALSRTGRNRRMTTFHIPDMNCGHCRATVEKAIRAVDPDARVEFDMEARRIDLDCRAEPADVRAALASAGYPATTA